MNSDASTETTSVLGFAGSLREDSYNRALLRAAVRLAPPSMTIEPFELGGIPLYNADRDTDERRPEEVRRFKQAIEETDALLVVTPEYLKGIPGVLKNAIDWASRPARRSVLRDKPAGIMGASTGAVGSARAQEQVKLALTAPLCRVMPHPGVLVAEADEKFEDGELAHEPTRRHVRSYLSDLEAWVATCRGP